MMMAAETVIETASFIDVYRFLAYLLALWVAGDFGCGTVLWIVPPLVGHIGVGVVVRASGWITDTDWPMLLGEVGLLLLMCQAGLDMDFQVLRRVGPRGVVMAVAGSILPTSIGFLLAYAAFGLNVTSSLAVGCSFGPTSAGIALNVLQQCGVLQTSLGQLIVAIAIVDDIIALMVLSQLKALVAERVEVGTLVVPIVSALLWLFLGGSVALYCMPSMLTKLEVLEISLIEKLWKTSSNSERREQSFRLAHVLGLLFGLLAATYFTWASPLLGSFLAGLSMCQHHVPIFNEQFGLAIVWLIRLFFGASIAFVVPIHLFLDWEVIARGCILSLALLGKVMVGPLLTPLTLDPLSSSSSSSEEASLEGERKSADLDDVDHRRRCFGREHIRDCLVVGFSMAGEAEFAMLVARFGFTEGLITEDIYASTLFAILSSTVLSPCLLRATLAVFPETSRLTPYHRDTQDAIEGCNGVDGVDTSTPALTDQQ